ncbi:MAG: hypothetical protein ACO25B_12505 [Chitinophagaceae bacterium]
MEVHHHAHTSRKKWTHYFWEFLMLFLAVFCGFMAEYQLEHKIEKDREKQFIHILLDDLREDTSVLQANIEVFKVRRLWNDTLMRLLYSPDIKEHGSDLYFFARHASRSVRLAIHDATFQQLKNSGGLRLIRNQKAAKAIVEYYNRIVFIDYLHQIENSETETFRLLVTEIFHPEIFRSMITPDNKIIRPPGNPVLLTYDTKMLLKLAGQLSYISNTKLGLLNAQGDMKKAAIDLIDLIKKEYKIR